MRKISVLILATSLTACGGGSSNSSGSSTNNETPIAGTSLDCNGTRIWGPAPQDADTPGVLDYASEGFGLNNGPECIVLWEYNTSAGCSDANLVPDGFEVTARIQADGSLIVRLDGEQGTLQPADVSIEDLRTLPDC